MRRVVNFFWSFRAPNFRNIITLRNSSPTDSNHSSSFTARKPRWDFFLSGGGTGHLSAMTLPHLLFVKLWNFYAASMKRGSASSKSAALHVRRWQGAWTQKKKRKEKKSTCDWLGLHPLHRFRERSTRCTVVRFFTMRGSAWDQEHGKLLGLWVSRGLAD